MSKQQLKYEISKLEPDSRGLFTVRFPKPDEDYTPEVTKIETFCKIKNMNVHSITRIGGVYKNFRNPPNVVH